MDFFKVEEDQAVDSIDPQDPFLDPCVHGALGDVELLCDFSYSFRGIWFVTDTTSCPGQLTCTGVFKELTMDNQNRQGAWPSRLTYAVVCNSCVKINEDV